MEIMLRTETPYDYGSIAELHALSFTHGFGIGESTLTSCFEIGEHMTRSYRSLQKAGDVWWGMCYSLLNLLW